MHVWKVLRDREQTDDEQWSGLIPTKLDDWYREINSIYLDRNFYRTPESIFCHLVEVVGGFSLIASAKKKPGVEPTAFLAKSIGWWMVLCGKVGVRSIERSVIWPKFPYVCAYCHRKPHNDAECKIARKARRTPDWQALRKIGEENSGKMPETVASWQQMFNEIYPKTEETTHQRIFSRLAEELSELAEAVRALPITRTYFLNESADVFAWLMGEANQLQQENDGNPEFLQDALKKEYPGGCRHCGTRICKCPPILKTTLSRIANEGYSLTDSKQIGDALFSVEEATQHFEIGPREITIGEGKVAVNPEMISELAQTTRIILQRLEELKDAELGAKLARVLWQLESLTAQQQISQATIDEIVTTIRTLPLDKKGIVVDFLKSLASSAVFQLILTAATIAH